MKNQAEHKSMTDAWLELKLYEWEKFLSSATYVLINLRKKDIEDKGSQQYRGQY